MSNTSKDQLIRELAAQKPIDVIIGVRESARMLERELQDIQTKLEILEEHFEECRQKQKKQKLENIALIQEDEDLKATLEKISTYFVYAYRQALLRKKE